jgi:hypothetical protein
MSKKRFGLLDSATPCSMPGWRPWTGWMVPAGGSCPSAIPARRAGLCSPRSNAIRWVADDRHICLWFRPARSGHNRRRRGPGFCRFQGFFGSLTQACQLVAKSLCIPLCAEDDCIRDIGLVWARIASGSGVADRLGRLLRRARSRQASCADHDFIDATHCRS